MNEIFHAKRPQRTTQAAEGVPRWRWTTAELVRLTELGAFTREDQFELIGGEIVPMSPVSRGHEVLAEEIERFFRDRETREFHIVNDRQLNLADDTYTEPDIFVRPAGVRSADARGETVLLIVEVAVTSLTFDLTTKARTYALHGVRDYWVVDAATLRTTIHRRPTADGYAEVSVVEPSDTMSPLLVPGLAIQLSDIRID